MDEHGCWSLPVYQSRYRRYSNKLIDDLSKTLYLLLVYVARTQHIVKAETRKQVFPVLLYRRRPSTSANRPFRSGNPRLSGEMLFQS